MTDNAVVSLPFHDAPARERISIDLEMNLLVEAGAGSGKTTELVSRMVALVGSGKATVEEIAAVTFTRKAAAELRERFQIRLEHRVREEAGGGGDDLLRERLARALDDIDRVFIGTIHAFCARLLRERPLEVGLDPAFQELPVEERIRVRRHFWEAYLERLVRDADPILEELSDAGLQPSRLWGLFNHLVENPDVDFPTDEVASPKPSELTEVCGQLEELVDRAWELMPDHEPQRSWDPLQKKLRTLHFTRDVTGWKKPPELFDALSKLCKSGSTPHKITKNRWKDGDLAKALCDNVNAFGVGDTPAHRLVNRWYGHRYRLAVRLGLHAARDFAAHRKRTGRLDFQDLLVLTADLLRGNNDVRKQLGRRYRRILIDEFQDTDPLQAEIMLLLASEPNEEEPEGDEPPLATDWRSVAPREGALFVVGDPKQSIYRFRRADIQLYGFVKDRFRDFGDVLELTTNFRSRPPIGDLVNELFQEEGFFPPEATPEQASFEPLNTRPPQNDEPDGVFWYAIAPEGRTNRGAAEDDAGRIATWIAERLASGERTAGDFLILTRLRSNIAVYARALEGHSVPVQVTGAGVGVEQELRELQALLECMIDPTNPVKVLAVLVGLFFGIDYERLVQHRLAGGAFEIIRPRGGGHPDVDAALEVLGVWWRAASTGPADVFVSRVTSELGLLPFAAAGDLGSLRAGALLYALDAVRAAALAGDASLPGALEALRAALDLSEAEAPLEPGRPDVVRLMNLHQAKGLEAEVVVLADPTGARARNPEIHMSRGEDGTALGYLRVTESRGGWGGDQVLALPEGWDEKDAKERGFEAAEEVRLLYVATTRAKKELLVARWPGGPGRSPWRALDGWLDERAEELRLFAVDPPEPDVVDLSPEDAHAAAEAAQLRLEELRAPSFRHRSVTEIAKGDPSHATSDVPSGEAVPRGAFRGFSWGSAVHGALAAAAAGVSSEALRAVCRDLLIDYERPKDDHGDPTELMELLAVVEKVFASKLWARAQAADKVLAEVPFSVVHVRETAAEQPPVESTELTKGKKQLDLFGMAIEAPSPAREEKEDSDVPEILEGVIDLAFREKGGWVIADYKTDVGTDPDFGKRVDAYRRQVDLYAEAWTRLTGDPVKERVLFFTAQDKIESW